MESDEGRSEQPRATTEDGVEVMATGGGDGASDTSAGLATDLTGDKADTSTPTVHPSGQTGGTPTDVIERARAATDERYQAATKLREDVAQLRVQIGELMSVRAGLVDDLATLHHDLATANEPAALPASPSPQDGRMWGRMRRRRQVSRADAASLSPSEPEPAFTPERDETNTEPSSLD
jgi:hypothetical protein